MTSEHNTSLLKPTETPPRLRSEKDCGNRITTLRSDIDFVLKVPSLYTPAPRASASSSNTTRGSARESGNQSNGPRFREVTPVLSSTMNRWRPAHIYAGSIAGENNDGVAKAGCWD